MGLLWRDREHRRHSGEHGARRVVSRTLCVPDTQADKGRTRSRVS